MDIRKRDVNQFFVTYNNFDYYSILSSICLLLMPFFLSACETTAYQPAQTSAEEYYISPNDLSRLKTKGVKGDVVAAEKLVNYFRFVELNRNEEKRFLRILAESGSATAQYNLSVRLRESSNIANKKEGIYWLTKSANSGLYYAQKELARHYDHVAITIQNCDKAIHWYEIIAYKRDIIAMIRIAEIYIDGKCIDQDYATGLTWLIVAESFPINEKYKNKIGKMKVKILPFINEKDMQMVQRSAYEIKKNIVVTKELIFN